MALKRYRVGYNYSEAGFVVVLASSEEQAGHIVENSLQEDGLDYIVKNDSYDTAHRSYEIDAVEEA